MKKLLPILFLITVSFQLLAQETLSYNSKEGSIKFWVSQKQYFIKFKRENKDAILRTTKKSLLYPILVHL